MAMWRRGVGATNLSWARLALTSTLLFGLLAGAADPADARRRHGRRGRANVQKEKAEPQRAPRGALFAVVSIADQHVSFYDAEGLWARGKVATGVGSHPTPTGLFVILEKERWHRSNLYYGASMPFMQRLAWTGVAMHQGYVPGRPASHGCIRLRRAFARRLFKTTKVGQRVIVSPYDIAPAAVGHPHLPAPKLQPGPAAGAPPANVVASREREIASDALAAAAPAGLLDPLKYATSLNEEAASRSAAAAKAVKDASLRLSEGAQRAKTLTENLKTLEESLEVTRKDLETAVSKAEKAHEEAAEKEAAELKAGLETRLAEMQKRVEEVRKAKAANDEEQTAAKSAVQKAREEASAAASMKKEALRRLEPLSMLISRKTGRLHVRQGFQTLFETSASIREPERPLGTHLFIVVQAEDSGDSGPALRWSALTVPAVTAWDERRRRSRRRSRRRRSETAAAPSMAGDSALGALDRVEIPPEAQERIAGLLWTGATLIVSDLGPSGEGRFAMDFQILTHARGRGR